MSLRQPVPIVMPHQHASLADADSIGAEIRTRAAAIKEILAVAHTAEKDHRRPHRR